MQDARYRLVEIIVAASVVVVSLASLCVALFQGHVMQRTLEAQVLPVLDYQHGNIDLEAGRDQIFLRVTNNGIGPADVRHMRLSWNGTEVTNPPVFLAECCVPGDAPLSDKIDRVGELFLARELQIITSVVENRFMAPEQRVDFVIMPRPDASSQAEGFEVWSRLNEVRRDLVVELCYCSVFDECWLADSSTQTREPVRECPVDEG